MPPSFPAWSGTLHDYLEIFLVMKIANELRAPGIIPGETGMCLHPGEER
jgi:hypothetical protein